MPTFPSTFACARAPFVLVPLLTALAVGQAQASTVTIAAGTTSNTAQTVAKGNGLAVAAGGTLDVHDGNIGVTVTGNGATIDNQGTMLQSGVTTSDPATTTSNRLIRDNTGVTGLVVNNGSAGNTAALMQTNDGDVIQMNKAKSSITLTNYGSMISKNSSGGGNQAVDFNAMTGSNVVYNYGLLKALEADAVRPGAGGVVNNWGTILSVTATGSSSDGIDMQSNDVTGVTINNNAGIVEGGRHGVTGGPSSASVAFTLLVNNAAGATIQGDNGSGINIDGFNANEVVTVNNAGTITGHGVTGDGDGIDVDGLLHLVNTGVIQSLNAVDPATTAFSEGLSIGGGTVENSGTIEGSVAAGNTNAKGIGITLSGNDITSGPNAGNRDGIYADASVTNHAGGKIIGDTSSAIVAKGLASGHVVTIVNEAGGLIQGGGTADAAIHTGLDAVTITDSGKIDGSSSGKAFASDGGTVTFNITGGSAVVLGSIDGGAGSASKMTISPGAGNTFAYASGISNFNTVDIASGTVKLSGQSSYTGTTTIESGANLVLDGANRLAAGSKLDLEGGTLKLVDVHGANAQEFAVLSVGKDSAIDLGGSSLTVDALGNVVAGKTLTITDFLSNSGDAMRFLGNLTGNAMFDELMSETTIDGLAASVHFDGVYTDVTAVPEPANVALLLAGLGLLGVAAQRRKRY